MAYLNKFCAAIVFGAMINTASAAQVFLPNYNSLGNALNNGEDVSAIVHFEKCTVRKDFEVKPGPQATSRINFDIFSHYTAMINDQQRETIATSKTILTEHHQFGPVYAYGRLRIFPDNFAQYHVAYYDAKNKELKQSIDYECPLTTNTTQGAIELYVKR